MCHIMDKIKKLFGRNMLSKIELESGGKSSVTVRNDHVFPLKCLCRLLQLGQIYSLHCYNTLSSIKPLKLKNITNVTCNVIFVYFDMLTIKLFNLQLNPLNHFLIPSIKTFRGKDCPTHSPSNIWNYFVHKKWTWVLWTAKWLAKWHHIKY